jgi:hypothetical protein
MKRTVIFLVAICLILWGCSCDDVTLAAFKNKERVEMFPYSYTLENGEALNFVPAGALDIAACGDSLFFSVPSEKFIYVYDYNDGIFSGSFLQKGNGPYEFLNPPFMQEMTFSEGIASIYHPNGHFYDFDYKSSILSGSPVIINDANNLPENLKNCFRVEDSTYYCREVRSDEKGLRRFLWTGGKESQNASIEILNEILLEGNEDGYRHNLLSSLIAYHNGHDIVVEAALYQDVINIYSLRKKFALSIVTGDNVNSIEELSTLPIGNFKDAYMDLRLYDNSFACLKAGNCVQFFDWQGNPLLQLSLPENATAFDVAWKDRFLFTYDIETERLYKYEIPEDIINRLK